MPSGLKMMSLRVRTQLDIVLVSDMFKIKLCVGQFEIGIQTPSLVTFVTKNRPRVQSRRNSSTLYVNLIMRVIKYYYGAMFNVLVLRTQNELRSNVSSGVLIEDQD